MIGVELVADPATRQAFDPALKVGAMFDALALENGLIIRAMGDTIGFCPPLIIDEAESRRDARSVRANLVTASKPSSPRPP